jgi:hypothetical protein
MKPRRETRDASPFSRPFLNLTSRPWCGGGFNEPAAVGPQVMPMGTPGEPVAPVIGTGVKT